MKSQYTYCAAALSLFGTLISGCSVAPSSESEATAASANTAGLQNPAIPSFTPVFGMNSVSTLNNARNQAGTFPLVSYGWTRNGTVAWTVDGGGSIQDTGVAVASAPSIAKDNNSAILVAALMPGGTVSAFWSDMSNRVDLGAPAGVQLVGKPSLVWVSERDGSVNTGFFRVFARGSDNQLYQTASSARGWGGWARINTPRLHSDPNALTDMDNRIDVVFQGEADDGRTTLCQVTLGFTRASGEFWYSGPLHGAWDLGAPPGGFSADAPRAVRITSGAPNAIDMHLMAVQQEGHLYVNTFTLASRQWSGWTNKDSAVTMMVDASPQGMRVEGLLGTLVDIFAGVWTGGLSYILQQGAPAIEDTIKKVFQGHACAATLLSDPAMIERAPVEWAPLFALQSGIEAASQYDWVRSHVQGHTMPDMTEGTAGSYQDTCTWLTTNAGYLASTAIVTVMPAAAVVLYPLFHYASELEMQCVCGLVFQHRADGTEKPAVASPPPASILPPAPPPGPSPFGPAPACYAPRPTTDGAPSRWDGEFGDTGNRPSDQVHLWISDGPIISGVRTYTVTGYDRGCSDALTPLARQDVNASWETETIADEHTVYSGNRQCPAFSSPSRPGSAPSSAAPSADIYVQTLPDVAPGVSLELYDRGCSASAIRYIRRSSDGTILDDLMLRDSATIN